MPVGNFAVIFFLKWYSCLLQVVDASELVAYCSGYFLKNMLSLLEQDSFRQLLKNEAVKSHLLADLQQVLAARMQAVYQPISKETMV